MAVKSGNKIAVFGGAFDPPHLAHIEIAKAAQAEYGYRKIVFLPSYNPPHKVLSGSAADRLNMLTRAISGNADFIISTYEIDRGKVGYTVDTLPELKSIYGDFDFIIGGDSMIEMHKWRCPEKILADNDIKVAVRNGELGAVMSAIDAFGDKARRVKVMSFSPQSISSTDIRLMVRLGEDISPYVASEVADYINEKCLYDDCKDIRAKLARELSHERMVHTKAVVHAAMKLNKQCGLPENKVFYAALLHDSAKVTAIDYSAYPIPRDSVNTPVAHAFAGAYKAAEYGVTDRDVLDAIYYHTTGRRDMSALEKLIYTADMIEETRDFAGVGELRELCYNDIERGFIACLNATYNHLKEQGKDMYFLTEEAYDFYKNN